jgi:hypothetical protein
LKQPFVVHIRRNTKRITLQRFLCSLIAWKQPFSEEQLAALFHNQLWLQQKCKSDRTFAAKFSSDLSEISLILKQANFRDGLTDGALTRMRNKLLTLEGTFLYPKRNLPQIKAKLANSIYSSWTKPLGVPTKELPPKRHIGMGYTDQGFAKDPATDASPSWQDVATASANLLRIMEELLDEWNQSSKHSEPLDRRLYFARRVTWCLVEHKKIYGSKRNLGTTEKARKARQKE